MILGIEGASASWEDNKLHIAVDEVPERRSHLDLKTGEILSSSGYAALRKQKDKAISAMLFVARREQNSAGAALPSDMRYVSGRGERDPEFDLIWRLPDGHLLRFHSLVSAGRTLRKAVIFFQHGELEFGWEPDGSGQKRDNDENPSVPIENVSFNFQTYAPSTDPPLSTKVPEGDDHAYFRH